MTLVEEARQRQTRAGSWEQVKFLRSAHEPHTLTVQPPDLVALLVDGQGSFMGGRCHPTLSLDGYFKITAPTALFLFLEFLPNSAQIRALGSDTM